MEYHLQLHKHAVVRGTAALNMWHYRTQHAALLWVQMRLNQRIVVLIQFIHQTSFYPNHTVTRNHLPTNIELYGINQD